MMFDGMRSNPRVGTAKERSWPVEYLVSSQQCIAVLLGGDYTRQCGREPC